VHSELDDVERRFAGEPAAPDGIWELIFRVTQSK